MITFILAIVCNIVGFILLHGAVSSTVYWAIAFLVVGLSFAIQNVENRLNKLFKKV